MPLKFPPGLVALGCSTSLFLLAKLLVHHRTEKRADQAAPLSPTPWSTSQTQASTFPSVTWVSIYHRAALPVPWTLTFASALALKLRPAPASSAPSSRTPSRVIVQCVVSLLFLAIQCTHSAIVDARPIARAWNLALRLTSSALGQ